MSSFYYLQVVLMCGNQKCSKWDVVLTLTSQLKRILTGRKLTRLYRRTVAFIWPTVLLIWTEETFLTIRTTEIMSQIAVNIAALNMTALTTVMTIQLL